MNIGKLLLKNYKLIYLVKGNKVGPSGWLVFY